MTTLSIFILLGSNAVTNRRDKSILYARIAITVLICCLLICVNSYYLKFHDKGLGLFNGFFHTTAITHSFHLFIFLISALILQLNGFFPRKVWTPEYSSLYSIIFNKLTYYNTYILNKYSDTFRILEYPLIILFVITGGSFLISSSDFISVFLSIELQSYGLYILCTVYKNSERAATGGLTYFLLGSLSSCFILLASSLVYANSGNTGFDGLFVINNLSNIDLSYIEVIKKGFFHWYQSYYISFSLIILSVGFLFKISAAPFHFWSPDVYDAIPTVVTTFVAIFAKISVLIILLELVHYTGNFFNSENVHLEQINEIEFNSNDKYNISLMDSFVAQSVKNSFNFSWTFTLLISSLLSLIIGTVLGLTQFRIKRLYAYSTISHIGFILLALTVNSIESIQSFIFYLMQYSLSNLNAFFILIAIGYSLYFYTEKSKKSSTIDNNKDSILKGEVSDSMNSPLQFINQMKGLFYINPMISISLALTLFSFVGIPPLMGFFAKQMVLSSALDSGYVFITFIAILTSVISAYYYLAVVKQIFFFNSDFEINDKLKNITIKAEITNKKLKQEINIKLDNITLSSSLTITISILTLITLFFILIPQEWLSMANILALIFFNT